MTIVIPGWLAVVIGLWLLVVTIERISHLIDGFRWRHGIDDDP